MIFGLVTAVADDRTKVEIPVKPHGVKTTTYFSPLGKLLLAGDAMGLTGLWMEGSKYFAQGLDPNHQNEELPLFETARHWLDVYFSGTEPDFMPPLHPIGSSFRLSVWEILQKIPYGETTTYGEIARMLAKERGIPRMSAQAVGGAVGHNPLSILIPCHRVLGSDGSLTGYAGGIEKKVFLLSLEQRKASAC